MSKVLVASFSPSQSTASFEYAPQREEAHSDQSYFSAVRQYIREWLARYQCRGCKVHGCPQCQKTK